MFLNFLKLLLLVNLENRICELLYFRTNFTELLYKVFVKVYMDGCMDIC